MSHPPTLVVMADKHSGRRAADAGAPDFARRFGEALRAGDPKEANAVASAALEAGLDVAAVQSQVITPAMRWIGDLWEHGDANVGDEHLATAITQETLSRLFSLVLQGQPRSRERIMLAAVQGEHHVLGLRMAADVLEGAGFDVLYLGADVPLTGLLEMCRSHTPAALGLGASMPLSLPTLIWEIEAVCALESPPAIFAAGSAVGAAIEQGLAVPRIDNTQQVVSAVEELLARPTPQPVVPAGLASRMPVPIAVGATAMESPHTQAEGFSQTASYGAEASRDSARHAFAMEQLAYRDPLTGLWNRRGYDDRFYELAGGGPVQAMVLMVDIDRFKGINDSFGHDAGDKALLDVAATMMRSVRPGDFVARLGGDEFAILLPGATQKEALAVGERIRASVEQDMRDPPVTVSVGAAPALANARGTALAVDHALYDAKEDGRNRVVVAAG